MFRKKYPEGTAAILCVLLILTSLFILKPSQVTNYLKSLLKF